MAHNPLRRSEERQSLKRQAAFENEVAFALTVTPFFNKKDLALRVMFYCRSKQNLDTNQET